MTKKKQYLTCDNCGKQDETVMECIDPYDLDVNDEEVETTLCEDCYQQRVDDV